MLATAWASLGGERLRKLSGQPVLKYLLLFLFKMAGAGTGGIPSSGGQAGTGGSGGDDGVRLVQNFNQSWKFRRSDVSGAEATAFDDSSWSNVGLPHSFDLPSFMETGFYAGYGWYRKHFDVPATWSGKSVSLEFQAAFDQAEIYVNGQEVGQHIGGYNGFSIDITSAVAPGDNVVAVRLNNSWNARIPPVTGDFIFSGGLYRDVNLVVTDPLHVAWYGTWVTTPTLADNSGSSSTVQIKTEVQNSRSATVNATLQTDIVDDTGTVVATTSSEQQIAAGETDRASFRSGRASRSPRRAAGRRPRSPSSTVRPRSSFAPTTRAPASSRPAHRAWPRTR